MYKARITGIKPDHHIESGKDFLDVTVEIVHVLSQEEREHIITEEDLAANPGLYRDVKVGDVVELAPEMVVDTQKHALDPLLGKEEVSEVVQKILDGYVLEREQEEQNRENEKKNKNVQELQETLIDQEFEPKESKE
jgi:hypothetical protein